jgi:hypothetical protein
MGDSTMVGDMTQMRTVTRLYASAGRIQGKGREPYFGVVTCLNSRPIGSQGTTDRFLLEAGRRRPLAWDAPTMGVNNNPVVEIIGVYEKYGIADIVVIPEWQGSVFTGRVFGRNVPTRAAEEACR